MLEWTSRSSCVVVGGRARPKGWFTISFERRQRLVSLRSGRKGYLSPLTRSCSIKQYSEAGAFALCEAWATRMQSLYNIYLGSLNPLCVFSEEDLQRTLLSEQKMNDVLGKVPEGKRALVEAALGALNEIRPVAGAPRAL